jgi:hypothetical protein
MARLEDLTTGTRVTCLTASGSATVESVQWIGEQALKVIYRDADRHLGVGSRPTTGTEHAALASQIEAHWLKRDWEQEVMSFASTHVIPSHLEEVRTQRLDQSGYGPMPSLYGEPGAGRFQAVSPGRAGSVALVNGSPR